MLRRVLRAGRCFRRGIASASAAPRQRRHLSAKPILAAAPWSRALLLVEHGLFSWSPTELLEISLGDHGMQMCAKLATGSKTFGALSPRGESRSLLKELRHVCLTERHIGRVPESGAPSLQHRSIKRHRMLPARRARRG